MTSGCNEKSILIRKVISTLNRELSSRELVLLHLVLQLLNNKPDSEEYFSLLETIEKNCKTLRSQWMERFMDSCWSNKVA